MKRSTVEQKLAQRGFVMLRQTARFAGQTCRWQVSDRGDPTYAAGFPTLRHVADWVRDRDELNASLPSP